MNCPECGSQVESDARFCSKCSARIEPTGLWRRFLCLFQFDHRPARTPGILNLKKTINIKTTDESGVKHEYHSFDELPPDLRAEMAELEAEASKGNKASARTIVSRVKSEVFKFKDAAGNERIYHSLEEMPPEIRAAVERARKGMS